jgi:hypothetical protein
MSPTLIEGLKPIREADGTIKEASNQVVEVVQ